MTEPRPFHVLAKPVGPACNLACRYCFYISRWDKAGAPSMDEPTLRRFTADYLAANPGPEVNFAWQGGEPTLAGLGFFQRAVAIQRELAKPGQKITNALQTNGVLLDDDWCRFLAQEGFLVGLSIDGPPGLHDAQRIDRGGQATFDRVVEGMARLKRHGVEFNTLTVVGPHNVGHPGQVYRFLRRHGSGHLQFIPLVERRRSTAAHDFAGPPTDGPGTFDPASAVDPQAWGAFLCAVFDIWVQEDVGTVFVRDFENWLGLVLGLPSTLCTTAATCGDALAIERDGTLYSCDHYVYPEYRLGRLGEQTLAEMVASPFQRAFGEAKRSTLTAQCRACPWLSRCGGGCPKHRFATSRAGEPGQDHLCAGWERFFAHSDPWFQQLAHLVRNGQPAERIKGWRPTTAGR
jgi:uncharacterized protein